MVLTFVSTQPVDKIINDLDENAQNEQKFRMGHIIDAYKSDNQRGHVSIYSTRNRAGVEET